MRTIEYQPEETHRTVDEFLDDMLSNLRTPEEIWAVARATRWASQADEIKAEAERRSEPRKK